MEHMDELFSERAYTQHVQQVLYAVIQQAKGFSEFHDGTIRMLLSDAWEELRLKPTALSPQDLETLSKEVDRFLLRQAFSKDVAARCERMLMEPFFARVDFQERGVQGVEKLVIGLYSLPDEHGNLLVHDWRAPVSSLYYDATPGEVSYESPGGQILGVMTLKRQYKMERGKLVYYVDTDLCIEDDLLLDILSGATSNRMRSIVSTIQSEQNRAIRRDKDKVLSVVGGAGSGKTSVAMHRAAYLMYRQRDVLDASSIATLSPSNAFCEYISGVLPDLGEENGRMLVLHKLYEQVIRIAPEEPLKQVERLAQVSYTLRRDSVRYKSGPDFVALLEGFAEEFSEIGPEFEDVSMDGTVLVPKGELERMYREEFCVLNPNLRLIRMSAVLQNRMEGWERSLSRQYAESLRGKYKGRDLDMAVKVAVSQRLGPVRSKIRRMLHVEPLGLYAQALRDIPGPLAEACEENAMAQLVWWEDAPGIAYLMLKLGFAMPDKTVRHLLVDEAQDYSCVAMAFLHLNFPLAQVTLLGDPNQRTSPGMPPCNPKHWGACFGFADAPIVRLSKCYRSTAQITRLCNAVLPEGLHVQEFGREGSSPVVRAYEPEALVKAVNHWHDLGVKRITIVTRALPEATRIAKLFSGSWLIQDSDDMMPETSGIVVSCYHLMKGLEFDAVAVVWPECELTEGERRRLYTACSRALHHLALMGDEKLIRELGIVL